METINEVTKLERGEIAVLTLNSPPVNALSATVRNGLAAGFKAAAEDAAIKAIVLICEGRTFIAGADITEFGKPAKESASLFDVQSAMEDPLPRRGSVGQGRPAGSEPWPPARRGRHAASAPHRRP